MAPPADTPTTASDRSWTITGASAETREKVKAAAQAEGMTIRAWVDKTLNAAADGRLVNKGGTPQLGVDPKTLADMQAKLDDIMKRLPDDPKAAEREAVSRVSSGVLKSIAGGLQEMQRIAKDQARVAEGKTPKRKVKKTTKPAASSTTSS